ncbi:MAG: peptide deformylase [Patescibacteria group bacterium]|nr:peptide deformylase [Patescibacteria group bacterium]
MEKLEIKKYNDPILRQECQLINRIDKEIKDLAQEMLPIMYEQDGIGLAGPQVGINKQIVVVDIGRGPLVLINPRITQTSKKVSDLVEGCLSFPEIYVKISRPDDVVVEARDLKGNLIEVRGQGLMSHALQHEIDHLHGRVIIDYLKGFKKIKAKNKIKKLEKRLNEEN